MQDQNSTQSKRRINFESEVENGDRKARIRAKIKNKRNVERFYEGINMKKNQKTIQQNKKLSALTQNAQGFKLHDQKSDPSAQQLIFRNTTKKNINNKEQHKCQCISQCFYSLCPCSQNVFQPCNQQECCQICILEKKKLLEKSCYSCKMNSDVQDQCKCIKFKYICDIENCAYKLLLQVTKKKKIRKKELKPKTNNTNIKVCLCKKSLCAKKYCECFASGQPCNNRCQCVGCLNQPSNYTKKNEQILADQEQQRVKNRQQQEQHLLEYVEEDNYQNMEFPQQIQFVQINIKSVKQNSS